MISGGSGYGHAGAAGGRLASWTPNSSASPPSAALILGLFVWLRQDVRQLRQEMSAQRGEINGRIDALRDETSGRIDALRDETSGRIDALRDEMKAQRVEINGRIDEVNGRIDGLRDEINGRIDALRDETGELRERVARIEGLLEAVFMRRDLTPLPDPAPSEPSRESRAA